VSGHVARPSDSAARLDRIAARVNVGAERLNGVIARVNQIAARPSGSTARLGVYACTMTTATCREYRLCDHAEDRMTNVSRISKLEIRFLSICCSTLGIWHSTSKPHRSTFTCPHSTSRPHHSTNLGQSPFYNSTKSKKHPFKCLIQHLIGYIILWVTSPSPLSNF